MRKIFTLLLLLTGTTLLYAQEDLKTIRGTVTDGVTPLSDVAITNLNTKEVQITDLQGKYTIKAAKKDVLKYSYNGMKDVTILVEDVTRILNIELAPETNALDEVVVKGSLPSQEDLKGEYVENKDVIRTAYGYLDSKRSGFNIRSVNLEDSNYNYVCLVELLRARFPEIVVFGTCSSAETRVLLRRTISLSSTQPVIFDVDGQLLTEAPVQIPVGEVKRIAVFRDLASRARYGTRGAGGVVVINTFNTKPKTGPSAVVRRMEKKFKDAQSVSSSSIVNVAPIYLDSMKVASSLDMAKNIYNNYESSYSSSPYFYLDSYNYFYNKGDKEFADEIMTKGYDRLFESNATLLKALAYTYQTQKRYELANEVLKQVFILRPDYAQSYLDIAKSFRQVDKPKFSAMMFARYNHLVEERFLKRDSIGFDPIFEREFENLVALNKKDIAQKKDIPNVAKLKNTSGVTRVLFEWNDSEAEFDLEFFKGSEQYYIWKHTYADSPEEILREKNYGYSVAEYIIDSKTSKPWQININYLGNKSLTPTYLKVTTYTNYGSKAQSEEVKLIKLTTKNIKQEVLTL